MASRSGDQKQHADQGEREDGGQDPDEKGSDGDGKGKQDGDEEEPKKKSRWPLIILAIVVIAALVGGFAYWFANKDLEDTDDAYTEGNAISIAPKVSGYVIERHIDDNSFVRAGDLMIRIDPRDYITARDQDRANLDLAQAQLAAARIDLQVARVRAPANLQQSQAQLLQSRANQINAQREYQRQHSVDPRATTATNVDQAKAQLRANDASVLSAQAQVQISGLVTQNIQSAEATVRQRQAQVAQAQASLAQAELNLSYTEIRAPQQGFVTRRNVDVGSYAQAGQQAFYFVTQDVWVVANFKETQLARMRVGQHVSMSIDAFPKLQLHGHVESFQQGSGARFTAFPAENATGNFVKIVRRVPVKIVIDDGLDPNLPLPLGISVDPTVSLK